jgi:RND family efflux transporter MFP subunit
MSRGAICAAIGLLTLLPSACRHSDAAEKMVPPTGTGAPPLPSLPALNSDPRTGDNNTDQALRATGTTQALHQAELGPKMSGVLAAVLVEEGNKVKKGQPLFRLEANNAALAVRQAQAGLAQAKVALMQAELDYNRTKALYEQGAVSPAVWDQARLGYDRATVAVQQAQVSLATAQTLAADTTVVAPFSGVVTAKKKSTGETVTMMPPTIVVVIQDLSKIEVRVKLAENALSRIRSGSAMNVHFNSLNVDRAVPIDRINPSVDPLSRTVEIVAVIPNQDGSLKSGMLVEVTFPEATAPPAPAEPGALPAQANTASRP